MNFQRRTYGGFNRLSLCCVCRIFGIASILLFSGFSYRRAVPTTNADEGQLKLTEKHIGIITAAARSRYRGYKPIDVVYTWVNGSDPQFQQDLDKYVALAIREKTFTGESQSRRFKDSDELRFSLRSLEKFAPWVRHVYLVTNGQIPYWLDVDSPHVTLVSHEDIFGETASQFLPTFSSGAIEARLFRIKGLGDYSIFFNDDFFLGRPVFPDDFISLSGEQIFYLEQTVVSSCSDGCDNALIGDGHCDLLCYNERCGFDGDDCKQNINTAKLSGDASTCSKGCVDSMLGNGICNLACDVPHCAFDAGDCSVAKLMTPTLHFFIFSPNNLSDVIISVPKPHHIVVADLSAIVPHGREIKVINCSTGSDSTLMAASFIPSDSIFVVMAYRNISYAKYSCTLAFADKSVVMLSITFYPFTASSTNGEFGNRIKLMTAAKAKENDAFIDSLRYVNSLLDRDFGFAQRHQAAHAPTLFQRQIVGQLYAHYHDEFFASASRRFRSSKDMQLHFSYIYYMTSLMMGDSEDSEAAIDKRFLNEFDIDRSGALSPNEFIKLYKKAHWNWPTLFLSIKQSNCIIDSASLWSVATGKKAADTRWQLTLKDVKKCPPLRKLFLTLTKRRPRYRWKIRFVGDKDAADAYLYVGIKNADGVDQKMNELRKLSPKFFCLNNAVAGEAAMVDAYAKVRSFLLKQFPEPSIFELPQGHQNRVKSIGELRQQKTKYRISHLAAVGACFSFPILLFICVCHRPKLPFHSSEK